MSQIRSGVYVDDFVEFSASLPAELQRLLSTMRELDERAQGLQGSTREQVKQCLQLPPQFPKKEQPSDLTRLRGQVEENHGKITVLCEEKVLLSQQAIELVDSHLKRLHEDLAAFEDELKQEGKTIPAEEPPPSRPNAIPFTSSGERLPRPTLASTPNKRLGSDLSRDRGEKGGGGGDLMRDSPVGGAGGGSLMQRRRSQPSAHASANGDGGAPERYCVCGGGSYGDMIACDNENCKGGDWFHYECVGLPSDFKPKGKWFCPSCRALQRKGYLDAY